MTGPIKDAAAIRYSFPEGSVVDRFTDDHPAGTVIGTNASSGAVRLGRDAERQIAIDNGALRFQPLIVPGWAREGIAYGPFRRVSGLTLAVSITNGHNTSQGSDIWQSFARRFRRWLLGPGIDPWWERLIAWAKGPRKKGTLRRFLWWIRSTPLTYRKAETNENLALGWFPSVAPRNPLAEGCCFIVHAALGENGELWARVGRHCLSAFRRLKNLRIFYVVVLRERGAAYYAAATSGAHALPGFPMMRPIAIDPFNADETVYAGIYQCALGQIGFRVDTRVHGVHIERFPELESWLGTAHAGDRMTGNGSLDGTWSQIGGSWRLHRGGVDRDSNGARAAGEAAALALLDPGKPSGLVHALVDVGEASGALALVWRARDSENCWQLRISDQACTLVRMENGTETVVASESGSRLAPSSAHSLQVLDGGGQIGCYLDGERLFDTWFEDPALDDATGVGICLAGAGSIRDFEAHPRQVPMPGGLDFEAPWTRVGENVRFADDFRGEPGDLAGRALTNGGPIWQRTLGAGVINVDGTGAARVHATVQEYNPGRTFYTLPWAHPDFADLEVTITPPGHGRGEDHNCRCGLVFWQDNDNYISFTAWLFDAYEGASVAAFPKRHGFEELYDAIWTMVWHEIDWGKPFRLRVAFDGVHFTVYVNGEPVTQRALTDIYPDDPPLRITRVGLAVNWEWGDDTGSRFHEFKARS